MPSRAETFAIVYSGSTDAAYMARLQRHPVQLAMVRAELDAMRPLPIAAEPSPLSLLFPERQQLKQPVATVAALFPPERRIIAGHHRFHALKRIHG